MLSPVKSLRLGVLLREIKRHSKADKNLYLSANYQTPRWTFAAARFIEQDDDHSQTNFYGVIYPYSRKIDLQAGHFNWRNDNSAKQHANSLGLAYKLTAKSKLIFRTDRWNYHSRTNNKTTSYSIAYQYKFGKAPTVHTQFLEDYLNAQRTAGGLY